MSQQETIDKIRSAVMLEQLIDITKFDEEAKKILMQVHPDRCSLPGANDAFLKINKLRTEFKDGFVYPDDIGDVTTNRYWVTIKDLSSTGYLQKSYDNYLKLLNSKTPASELIRKMNLPNNVTLKDDLLKMDLPGRAVPLKDISGLKQEHLNWLFSRLLDFSACIAASGFIHGGITPESVYVLPKEHGVCMTTYYHMHQVGQPIKSASGLHFNWYPKEITSTGEKIKQGSCIDLEMAKKCVIWAAGDKSGSGTMLRKTLHPGFVDMLLSHDEDPVELRSRYREWVAKNFEKKFVECVL